MRICRIETTVSDDGTVTVKDTPFSPGEPVEVVVCPLAKKPNAANTYPLRGTPIHYIDPFAGVAEDDWEAAQ